MNREEKADKVRLLNETFSQAKFAVVADYRGLKVSEMEQLRADLRKNQSQFQVAKNTLLKLAVQGTEYEELSDSFSGTTAVAFSFDDPVAMAKALSDFAKDNEALQVRCAVLDGKILSTDEVKAIAKLPSREQMLGQVCGLLVAVPTNFVRTLNGVANNLVYALQAIKDQKEN